MSAYVGESKEQLAQKSTAVIKQEVEKDSWIALRQYFCGAGNGPEAKIACVVLSTLAREQQAANNKRQLDLVERRISLEVPKQIETTQLETKAA